jgi:LCP family protein required for cell wall assembly
MSSTVERASRVRFRRAMSLMVMTLVVPGSAQLVAGNRKVGQVAFRIWLGLLGLLAVTLLAVVVDRRLLFWMTFDPTLLLLARLALIAAAIGWAGLLVDAWRLGQPLTLGMSHRRAMVGVNGLLCFGVAGVLLFGAHIADAQRDFILGVSGGGGDTSANDGRYNVLLLGGDSGAGRWGLRPDSMTIASVDEDSGRTVLIGLPRNLAKFPFAKGSVMREQFPDGFDCEGCYLNGVSTWAQDNPELFPDSENPGVEATVSAIEGITGLRINYWAMVNLAGFKGLVDAVGGVTLNVRSPIPVGGLGDDVTGYIEPGVRKLNGHDTLWYARAREGSDDYSRMARQKCVMNAMLEQVSPQSAVTNFADLAKASSEMLSTNVPATEFDTFAALALKARGEKISSLSLVPPMINTGDPDIKLVHRKIADAIDKAEGKKVEAPAKTKKKPAVTAVTGGSLGSLNEGYAANDAEDLGAAC